MQNKLRLRDSVWKGLSDLGVNPQPLDAALSRYSFTCEAIGDKPCLVRLNKKKFVAEILRDCGIILAALPCAPLQLNVEQLGFLRVVLTGNHQMFLVDAEELLPVLLHVLLA